MDPISKYNYLSQDINYKFLSEKNQLRSNLNKSYRTDQRKLIFPLKIGPFKIQVVSTDFSENGIFVDDRQSDA